MSFERPITIKEAVGNIYRKKYLLPAIQREFIWEDDQITKLFDSLMRGYPIGSFLFWKVEKENSKKFQFYEFIRNYHENKSKHNPKADISGEGDITAVLDGQQRLTALYLGLKGSVAYKLPRKRWNNPEAYPEKVLVLDLLASPEDPVGMEYDFRFVERSCCENNNIKENNAFWFRVGQALDFKEPSDVNDFLIDNGLSTIENKKQAKFANRTLFKLYDLLHKSEVVNYFLEKDESLDKVLNIFIRVNSGGTELNYSDLLLSIATAQWQKKDAREEIHNLVDEINQIGGGFNFDKDFTLKSCLVLSDFSDITFKVDNFNSQNMTTIEKNWDNISESIRSSVLLLSSFGYNRDTLTSNNAVIPIAYYLNKIDNPTNYVLSIRHKEDRNEIFRWLTISLLKRAFGGQPDNVLRPVRQVIAESNNGFPFDKIVEKLRGTTKSITFTDEEIDSLLDYKWGQKYTFPILALLYPTLDFRNKFHIDHIFPRSIFTPKRLINRGIADDEVYNYIAKRNSLANLQLLEGLPNQEKSGKEFNEWLLETYPTEDERSDYLRRNYIPDTDLSLSNFLEFFEERDILLRKKLVK
ncbi:MAG: DUF262 domain-containing protein, partial [Sedimentisphaerales bacterium]|nr:DUF262 domain-containing protein [Sedimentisphaerales bacterium]